MKIKYTWFFLILLILNSCETYIDSEFIEVPTHLVINALISPTDSIKIHISETENSFSIDQQYLSSKKYSVNFMSDNDLIIPMRSIGNGYYYVDELNLQDHVEYSVVIDDEGKTISSKDKIPTHVEAELLSFKPKKGQTSYGADYDEVEFVFSDPLKEKNYYLVSVEYEYLENIWDFDPGFETDSMPVGNYYLSSYDNLIQSEADFGEGKALSLFFSDELIDGKNCQLKLNCVKSINADKSMKVKLVFRSISEEYYKFIKQLLMYDNFIDADIVFGPTEPVSLYSNIEGGYGIFAFYQQSVSSFTYNPMK